MRCTQASEMMSLRLDGRLSNGEIASLDEHLVGCDTCQAEWRSLHRLHCTLDAAPMIQAPVRIRVNVMARLSRQDRARRAIVGGTTLVLGTATLALLVLLPALLGLLNTTSIVPAMFSGGPETAAHILGVWETLGRTLMVLCRNAIVPLALLGLCGLMMVLVLNGLWIALVRRIQARWTRSR